MKVTISGGVHGNELIGIYLVKLLRQESPHYELEVDYLLANPKAIEECRRYIDYDLNRSFSHFEDSPVYEFERAKVLRQRLQKSDFLIDLHTTTANMGITLVLSQRDTKSKNIAKILAKEFEEIRVLEWLGSKEGAFINSCVPSSITIEVGPVCQGVLDAKLFFQTKKVVLRILDILQRDEEIDEEIECYSIIEGVDFPRRDKEIFGMIHPEFLGRDYQRLHRGDPIFITFDEKEIFASYEGYPVFINEAAYYEKGVAFYLTKKIKI